ncbi:hypothetical protein ncot_16200 [Nocardioides sp. JQ2195]|uniref:hypothetical protein n=1 Tax=Nocardioides sp. JQ2195 TaxID=2592334 RepID=UPI00143E5FB6|nr:hypothetical protein [Nocardioides sp. JQ2195]QIX27958.1 hypothetical protein ncot_16200 [Nocardioides sp. JQ2195]
MSIDNSIRNMLQAAADEAGIYEPVLQGGAPWAEPSRRRGLWVAAAVAVAASVSGLVLLTSGVGENGADPAEPPTVGTSDDPLARAIPVTVVNAFEEASGAQVALATDQDAQAVISRADAVRAAGGDTKSPAGLFVLSQERFDSADPGNSEPTVTKTLVWLVVLPETTMQAHQPMGKEDGTPEIGTVTPVVVIDAVTEDDLLTLAVPLP